MKDLECFVEGYLDTEIDQYTELLDDVVGVTEFEAGRRPAVSIGGKLTETAEADAMSISAIGHWARHRGSRGDASRCIDTYSIANVST